MLLLLLSHFSRVQLCVTPQTAANQAPPSLGFSRQEHWSVRRPWGFSPEARRGSQGASRASWQDEALARYSVSREVPCSLLMWEAVLGSLDATPKVP